MCEAVACLHKFPLCQRWCGQCKPCNTCVCYFLQLQSTMPMMGVCGFASMQACKCLVEWSGGRRQEGTWSAASLAARTTLMKLPWLVTELISLSMSKLSPADMTGAVAGRHFCDWHWAAHCKLVRNGQCSMGYSTSLGRTNVLANRVTLLHTTIPHSPVQQ